MGPALDHDRHLARRPCPRPRPHHGRALSILPAGRHLLPPEAVPAENPQPVPSPNSAEQKKANLPQKLVPVEQANEPATTQVSDNTRVLKEDEKEVEKPEVLENKAPHAIKAAFQIAAGLGLICFGSKIQEAVFFVGREINEKDGTQDYYSVVRGVLKKSLSGDNYFESSEDFPQGIKNTWGRRIGFPIGIIFAYPIGFFTLYEGISNAKKLYFSKRLANALKNSEHEAQTAEKKITRAKHMQLPKTPEGSSLELQQTETPHE